jgi:hypothetical protein
MTKNKDDRTSLAMSRSMMSGKKGNVEEISRRMDDCDEAETTEKEELIVRWSWTGATIAALTQNLLTARSATFSLQCENQVVETIDHSAWDLTAVHADHEVFNKVFPVPLTACVRC